MQKLSRSKIELFLDCPQCLWLDVKQGVKRPPGFPFTINNAVDYLLKQEFDLHREAGTPHAVMKKFGVDAVPFKTPEMAQWRHNFTGVRYEHAPTDLLVFGAVDDVWVNPKGELMVVDYKATGANEHKIHDSYRRQMEIYQWLLRKNNFIVSPTGYFVFAKVNKANGFASDTPVLSFDLFVEPMVGDDSWIEPTLPRIRETINSDVAPKPSEVCEYCKYRASAERFNS